MAENKKQHYVPKFYLKLFSNNQSNSHIKIFVKYTNKIIPNGDLKNQAYKNYFYGKDTTIEKEFSKIEDEVSRIISEIIESKALPKRQNVDFESLWLFTFIQNSRTKYSADETNKMINQTLKTIFKNDNRFKDKIDEVEFGYENPVLLNLDTLTNTIAVTKDLKCKLIINQTNKPFVTSDNPIVLYNQFLEQRNHQFGKCGLASKGLQVFYPINPELALIYYDEKVYKIGFRKRNYIETSNEKDIESLNILQFLNSDKVVYSNEIATDYYLETLMSKASKYNTSRGSDINEYPEKRNDDGTYSVILHNQKKDLEMNLNLSFIKQTTHGKTYKMSGYVAELRNEEMRNK
ncbi:DUF4238 domain-containing protein [uncultured Algibacter sp.]|uniref:DUF4238 domain-containing protein n=1 Tax=uncultured Algibacter sp. TaxID=298659 RepID=UPI002616213E|nr:DUF4238 domain-containing protein [uncultured Algibacter sp.]